MIKEKLIHFQKKKRCTFLGVGPMSLNCVDVTIDIANKYEIPIYVYVSRVDAQDSQETLDSYLASTGSSSVKAQVESDVSLGGAANSVRVIECKEVGLYNINNIDYLGAEFTVEVIA